MPQSTARRTMEQNSTLCLHGISPARLSVHQLAAEFAARVPDIKGARGHCFTVIRTHPNTLHFHPNTRTLLFLSIMNMHISLRWPPWRDSRTSSVTPTNAGIPSAEFPILPRDDGSSSSTSRICTATCGLKYVLSTSFSLDYCR